MMADGVQAASGQIKLRLPFAAPLNISFKPPNPVLHLPL